MPTTTKALGDFLGLIGYYRKFIPNYSMIIASLTNMLCKNPFLWTDEARTAFEKLKTIKTTTLVLAQPKFDQPFIMECDASDSGLGAVVTRWVPNCLLQLTICPTSSQASYIWEWTYRSHKSSQTLYILLMRETIFYSHLPLQSQVFVGTSIFNFHTITMAKQASWFWFYSEI